MPQSAFSMNETTSSLLSDSKSEVSKNKKTEQATAYAEKCAICLQKFTSVKSKSYAAVCFHSFCFECLLEWTKVKYSCPLCKRNFDRIIYDLQTRLQFKEYMLKPREEINTVLEIIEYNNETQSYSAPAQPPSIASWLLNKESAPVNFRMRVYQKGWYVNPYQTQHDITITNIDMDLSDDLSPSNLSSVNTVNDNLPCLSYKAVSKFRNTSDAWFKSNPACAHRLSSFLSRELKALIPSKELKMIREQLAKKIINLIKKVNISSEEFVYEISDYIKPIRIARHFQLELLAFARSTSPDLIDYDAKCVYYSELESMPTSNQSLESNSSIIPFQILAVNLNKYRLLKREELVIFANSNIATTSALSSYYNMFDASLTVTRSNSPYNQTSRSSNLSRSSIPIETIQIVDTEPVQSNITPEQRSDSEFSSYCEEVEPPPKPIPVLIELIESDTSDNDARQAGSVESLTIRNISNSRENKRSESVLSRSGSSNQSKKHKHKRSKKKKSSRSSRKHKRTKKMRHRSRSRRSRSRSNSRSRRRTSEHREKRKSSEISRSSPKRTHERLSRALNRTRDK